MMRSTAFRRLKLAKEIGIKKSAEELGISANTIAYWIAETRRGKIDLDKGSQTPESELLPPARLNADGK
jgi:transposase-like protein